MKKVKKSFLKRLIEELGISQADICVATGWSPQLVSYMCNPRSGFELHKIKDLAKGLKISESLIVDKLERYLSEIT